MLVALFSLSLLLINIGGVVLSRHEVLAAQPAREMLSDGHWIVPTIAGEYRVNKPPTMAWFIATSMAIFQSKSEWVARLPAVLSGVLTCVLVASMTAQHLGRRTGLIAGLLTATSFFVLLQARLSEADMPLAMCVTLAFWVLTPSPGTPGEGRGEGSFGEPKAPNSSTPVDDPPIGEGIPIVRHENRHPGPLPAYRARGLSLLFYFAVGLSFLLKGVGPIFILPAGILYALLSRDQRAKKILLNPWGIALLLVLLVAWPLAAWKTYPDIVQGWRRETLQRVTGELGEKLGKSDPFLLYFYSIPMMLLPWFPLAIVGAIAGIKARWHRHRFGLMLLCWFGVGFVLLHLNSWKHNHYSMPILPACMPAAAVGLMLWLRHNYAKTNPRHLLSAVGWTVACVAAVLFVLKRQPNGANDIAVLIGIIGVGGLVLIGLEHLRRQGLQFAALFAVAWLVAAGVFLKITLWRDGYQSSAELGRRVSEIVPAETTVTLLGLGEHHITYYLDRPMRRIDEIEKINDQAASLSRPAYILAQAIAKPTLQKLGTLETIDRDATLNRRETEANRVTLYLLR